MSGLNDLRKKLYQKETNDQPISMGDDFYNPTKDKLDQREDDFDKIKEEMTLKEDVLNGEKNENNQIQNNEGGGGGMEDWRKKADFYSEKSKSRKFLFIGLAAFVVVFLLILGALVFARYKESLFSLERVSIILDGQAELGSGQETKYILRIANQNKVALKDVQIKINFPGELAVQPANFLSEKNINSVKIDVEEVSARDEVLYELGFDVFGEKDFQGYLDVEMKYKPANFNSYFERSGQFGFAIKSSALDLLLFSTREASSGEMVEIKAIIENKGERDFENVYLEMDYPEGFSFSQSSPVPSENQNMWFLQKIIQNEKREIVILGNLTGDPNLIKNFSGRLKSRKNDGSELTVTKSDSSTKIASNRIEIVNIIGKNFFDAGNMVDARLRLKNTSGENLRDLILVQKFSSPVIEKESVKVKNGFYDSREEKITWKASELPSLANLGPEEEIFVDFSFNIKEKFPMESEGDKNFVVDFQPEVESLDVNSPLGQNKKIFGAKTTIKVRTKIILDLTASYRSEDFSLEGNFPPKVDEKSTFAVKLNLRNTSNDLKNAVLFVDLPVGVSWENEFIPNGKSVSFNERTNQITWNIGTIPAGTGFIAPVENLSFKIGVVPSANQEIYSLPLVSKIRVSAEDVFVGGTVEYLFNGISLGLVKEY